MTIDCPICRRPFSTPEMSVDLNSSSIIAAGKVVRLFPREAEILSVLIEAYPLPVARDLLAKQVFGEPNLVDMKAPNGCIAVHVNRLQRKMAAEKLPFSVVNSIGQGFRLDAGLIDEPPRVVEAISA